MVGRSSRPDPVMERLNELVTKVHKLEDANLVLREELARQQAENFKLQRKVEELESADEQLARELVRVADLAREKR
jgi:hypothetical protein